MLFAETNAYQTAAAHTLTSFSTQSPIPGRRTWELTRPFLSRSNQGACVRVSHGSPTPPSGAAVAVAAAVPPRLTNTRRSAITSSWVVPLRTVVSARRATIRQRWQRGIQWVVVLLFLLLLTVSIFISGSINFYFYQVFLFYQVSLFLYFISIYV